MAIKAAALESVKAPLHFQTARECVLGASSISVSEDNVLFLKQRKYNWDDCAPFSFHWLSPTHSIISAFLSTPPKVITIKASLSGSADRLSCSFQTVGSSWCRTGATLRTDEGSNTPSVSHVGSKRTRALTITIRTRKMVFSCGKKAVFSIYCSSDSCHLKILTFCYRILFNM